MAGTKTLAATERKGTGKGAARSVRREGRISRRDLWRRRRRRADRARLPRIKQVDLRRAFP